MQAALAEHGGLWFGWSGRLVGEHERSMHRERAGHVDYALVDLTRAEYERYYLGFANRTLWPLLHFRSALIEFKRADLAGYLEVNRMFAERLAGLLRSDDLVWGARLPPDTARRRTAPARCCFAHRLLPARTGPTARPAGRAPAPPRAVRRALCVRPHWRADAPRPRRPARLFPRRARRLGEGRRKSDDARRSPLAHPGISDRHRHRPGRGAGAQGRRQRRHAAPRTQPRRAQARDRC